MTGTTLSSDTLDPRRRRLLFRAWRRGTREMDLVMGKYADANLPDMDDDTLAQFEALIDAPDTDLFNWITGAQPVPQTYDTALFRAMQAFSLAATRNV